MTRKTIHEYAAALRGRYRKASKKEKSVIVSEFCQTTGYHRKSAIRLLSHTTEPAKGRPGRPREYGSEVARALRVAWQATGYVGAKRLTPFLPDLIPLLECQRELNITADTRTQLLRVGASTVDRLLKPFRPSVLRRPYNSTPAAPGLRAQIPLRTFADWSDVGVGYMEIDLVAHCGRSSEGFFLYTLVAVDIASGWTYCLPIWGKNFDRMTAALEHLRRDLPFPLLGIDSDNGGEFINHDVYKYCRDHGIQFTRSRPYKKNDQAYVEQKNWTAVRKLIGYDRYATKAAYEQMGQLYQLLTLHTNYFQPVCKLIHKERNGAHVHKRYDRGQTPLQRLIASGVLHKSQQQELMQQFQSLNPIQLQAQIEDTLPALWKLADRGSQRKAGCAHQAEGKNGLEEGERPVASTQPAEANSVR